VFDQGHLVNKPAWFLALANCGGYALVPLVIVGLVLPAGLLAIRAGGAPQIAPVYVEKCSALLIPALAAWWPAFAFKERIEGDGRELLYFLRRKGEGALALAIGLLYLVVAIPFTVVALGVEGFSASVMLLLAVRCVFVTSLAFSVAYVLRSSALGLVLALLFNMAAMNPLEAWVVTLGPTAVDFMGLAESGTVTALYAVAAAVLLLTGEIRGRYFAE
jgi:hypothetical protein